MKALGIYLAIAAGGALGAVARYALASGCGRWFGTGFPVGTFVINITGSLFLGWFATAVGGRLMVSEMTRLAIATGFVGAYTTFSTFMFESAALMDSGAALKAALNLIGSLLVGLAAVRLGIYLGQH